MFYGIGGGNERNVTQKIKKGVRGTMKKTWDLTIPTERAELLIDCLHDSRDKDVLAFAKRLLAWQFASVEEDGTIRNPKFEIDGISEATLTKIAYELEESLNWRKEDKDTLEGVVRHLYGLLGLEYKTVADFAPGPA